MSQKVALDFEPPPIGRILSGHILCNLLTHRWRKVRVNQVGLCALLILLSFVCGAQPIDSSVLSFNEWKSEKIQSAQTQYKTLEEGYLSKKKLNSQDPGLKGLYAELKHAKEAVSDLSDLSVTDYFIGYLSQFKSKKSVFQAAVTKLAPDEISELMSAYANSLLKTSGEGLSTAADSEKPK